MLPGSFEERLVHSKCGVCVSLVVSGVSGVSVIFGLRGILPEAQSPLHV